MDNNTNAIQFRDVEILKNNFVFTYVCTNATKAVD